MKNIISIAVFALCMTLMCSCELETSGNGEYDGMWHLVSVDTLSTGGVRQMDGEMIYWSFQYNLLQLDDKAGIHGSVLFRFERSAGTLRLYDPYLYDRENGDSQLTDVSLLAPFGVNALDETFKVENIGGGKMVLSTDDLRLAFRKF